MPFIHSAHAGQNTPINPSINQVLYFNVDEIPIPWFWGEGRWGTAPIVVVVLCYRDGGKVRHTYPRVPNQSG